MKVTFLGTNGWYDSPTGKTPCVLLDTGNEYLVFDAGNGFSRLDQYLTRPLPVYCFFSHYHLDHVIGLHTLVKNKFERGIHLFGPGPAKETLATLLSSPFSVELADMPFQLTIADAPQGLNTLPFQVEALPLVHTAPCLGYRVEIGGKSLAYCTDTGYCANAVTLAKAADLLITECALLPGQPDNGWPHLNPELAARIALEADAKRLVLMHFDAANYCTLEQRELAQQTARQIFANTDAAVDDLEILL